MRRILTTWLLLVAVGLPWQVPALGSWHCPDGTLCVAAPDGGYQCSGGAYRMACCVEQGKSGHGGCHDRCRHGALPGAEVATAPAPPGIACTCQFTPAAHVVATAAVFQQHKLFGVDSVTPALPLDQPLVRELQRVGYVPTSDPSPASPPGTPSLGPRAPPMV